VVDNKEFPRHRPCGPQGLCLGSSLLSATAYYKLAAAFVLIYKHLVRSHLEYNNSVWAPYRKLDIDKLEKVQKRAKNDTRNGEF